MRRRSLIKAMASAPLAGWTAPIWARPAFQKSALVFDASNPLACAVAKRAEAMGFSVRPTDGEIVALLLADRTAQSSALWGVTGYAEMMLARDILRSHGRTISFTRQLGAKACAKADVAQCNLPSMARALLHPVSDAASPTTAFLWGI